MASVELGLWAAVLLCHVEEMRGMSLGVRA